MTSRGGGGGGNAGGRAKEAARWPSAPPHARRYVDGAKGSGWWYEGAGIYRHVKLIVAPEQHIEMDGIFADARLTGPVSSGAAPALGHTADSVIHASVTAVNDDPAGPAALTARYSLYDLGTGEAVGAAVSSPAASLPAAAKAGAVVSVG